MILKQALEIAERTRLELAPHCLDGYCRIAGSVRREKPEPGDIEIVCIPKSYDATPLFASGIATVVNRWKKVKGNLPCKYTQRLLPGGIKLDLFMVTPENFGLQFAIRTGSADFSHYKLACRWVELGYHSEGGFLRKNGKKIILREEIELFKLLGMKFVEPKDREI